MELIDFLILVATLTLAGFLLGASIMWTLEARDRRLQPLWLVVARYLTFMVIAVGILFRAARTDVRLFDPAWMSAIGVISIILTVVAFVAELRQRSAADSSDRRTA